MARRPEQLRRDRRLRPKWEKERQKQRLIITVFVVIVVLAIAIPAFGYYYSFVRPPRTVAARVGNTTYTMGDLVKQLRVLQAHGVFSANSTAIATAPMEILYTTVQKELIKQGAVKMGITVTREEVQQVIKDNFYPVPPEGQEVDGAQLEKEFKEKYRSYLTSTTLSAKEYEKSIEYSLYQQKLRTELGRQVPNVAEQVEAHWIVLQSTRDIAPVQERLKKGEDFATVAKEFNTDYTYADENGYVGWVPKGAFRQLDKVLFEGEKNKMSDPVTTANGTYLVKVTAGPEVREVSEKMKEALKDSYVEAWLGTEWEKATSENRLAINFNSDWYAWLVKQLRLSAPPTPTPTPG